MVLMMTELNQFDHSIQMEAFSCRMVSKLLKKMISNTSRCLYPYAISRRQGRNNVHKIH